MYVLQHPSLPTVAALPMAIGQELIELVCHPPRDRSLPLATMERLAIGLEADFCLVAAGRRANEERKVWFWSANDRHCQCLSGTHFWQNPWVKAIAASETPVDYASAPEIPLPAPLACQTAIGLRTIFQGKVNGLVILGNRNGGDLTHRQGEWLAELQSSLGVVTHLLRTTAPTPWDCCQPAAPVARPQEDAPIALLSAKKLMEDSPIVRLWYDATRQQLEQQRQWNEQLIHNIITIMSDQTRNPLATIRMGIEMLRKTPPTGEQLHQRLAIIEAEWRKLNTINDKILQLRNLQADQDTVLLHQFDLVPVLQAAMDALQPDEVNADKNKRPIETEFAEPHCLVVANYAHLQQILTELLTNAQKFSVPASPIRLALTTVDTGGQRMAQLQCTNLAVGPIPRHLKSLFDPFYREQWAIDSAIAGIGLGLTIIKTLIEQLNGKIDVACEPATEADRHWITFTLWIPGALAGR